MARCRFCLDLSVGGGGQGGPRGVVLSIKYSQTHTTGQQGQVLFGKVDSKIPDMWPSKGDDYTNMG